MAELDALTGSGVDDLGGGALTDDTSAESARTAAATRTARAVKHETPYDLAPRPRNPDELARIAPGLQWVDPDGEIHTKPYAPKSVEDYRRVPEGAKWINPKGEVNTKPTYDDVPVVAQTIYNMTTNEKEQENALELFYPGKVRREGGTNDLYVELDDGKKLKPRGFTKSPISTLLAGLAPTVGAAVGEAVVPIAGAVVGASAGQGFNDLLLKGSGIYDRSVEDEIGNLGVAGLMGGTGSVLGGQGGRMAAGGSQLTKMSPAGLASTALGVDAEGMEMALALKAKGVQYLPVSMYAKEAPHLVNVTEVYDRAFHLQQPLLQSAEAHMENQGRQILGKLGKDTSQIDSLVHPSAAVPTKEAGETILTKARDRVREVNAKLNELLSTKDGSGAAKMANKEQLQAAEKEARSAATDFINAVYKDIEKDVQDGMRLARSGHNSGDLWEGVANKFVALRRASQAEAQRQYGLWEREFGSIPQPKSLALAGDAENFLAMLPPEFQSQYPGMVRLLKKLGGEMDAEGQVIKEPVTMTLGELHDLRSLFRYGIDWRSMRSDMMNGAKKLFEDKIDNMIEGEAGSSLKKIDKWYKDTFQIYSDKRLQATINGLEGGEPADPRTLYDVLIKEGRTDLNKKFEQMLGPNLWAGIRAADADALLRESLTETEGVYDGRSFIRGVIDRHRSGMLESIHGKETADKWLSQVRNLKLLDGRLDLPLKPGDRVPDVIQRVHQAVQAIRTEKERDPLGLLHRELQSVKGQQRAMRNEPLGFLYDPKMGAEEAVDKILSSPQHIYAAEQMFGRYSEEFNLIQQVAAQRILQGEMEPGAQLVKLSPEIQQSLFGIAADDMKLLAKEMHALMGTKGLQDTAKSMAAQSLVNHPFGGFLGRGGSFLPKIPGADFAGRSILGGYYGMIRKITSSQWFLNFLKSGLKSSDPAERAAATRAFKARVRSYMKRAAPVGAGGTEALYQGAGQDNPDYPGEAPPPIEKPPQEMGAQ